MIGGGRVCGCELLEVAGVTHGHHHHSDNSCSDHHHDHCSHDSDTDAPSEHEPSPDCCDLLTLIEVNLPEPVELPDLKQQVIFAPFLGEQSRYSLPCDLVSRRWYYPPPEIWADSYPSLSSLQRFQV